MTLKFGDCLEQLKGHKDNSVDAVVTDPPYGLSFMGKKWDYDVPSVELWREVLRVLKPGGHLLSFGGTRTYHRMVVNIEDAGFEIRDQIQWLYGSGFPKSLDVSKAIDKAAGAEREVIQERLKNGDMRGGNFIADHAGKQTRADITAPATDDAKRWQGWGTALKPANEPIVLARKPIEKGLTVAENVLKWGTGAINVDGTRIGLVGSGNSQKNTLAHGDRNALVGGSHTPAQGRWPANVLFDEEAAAVLDEQVKGRLYAAGNKKLAKMNKSIWGSGKGFEKEINFNDFDGGASRFFYVAKCSKRERNAGLEGMPAKPMNTYNFSEDGSFTKNATAKSGEQVREARMNHHPTVKPIKLMEYLCKLITPPGGVILDPFMGSGSTGCAAVKLGYVFIGIEREKEYIEIAKKRIEHWQNEKSQMKLPIS